MTTFLDCQDLQAGLPWGQALEKVLGRVRAVAVFLGPDGLGGWQKREIGFALERQVQEEERGREFPVIPVLLKGAKRKLSFLLQDTWVDLRDDLASPKGIQALVGAVQGKRLAPREKALVDFCPYLDLKSFHEEDAAFFCGREEFTDSLLRMVLSRDLVAVLGDSGSGKSSVIHAGLLPKLRRQRPPDKTWDVISFFPGDEPFYQLATGILRLLEPDITDVDRPPKARKLAGILANREARLEDYLDLVLATSRGTDRLLIIVDQFEELFTLTPSEVQRPFVDMLLQARAKGRCSLLLSLRGEFYGRTVALSRELSDLLEQGVVNVGPMTRDELKQAIKGPADRVGLEFEAGLDTTIVDDAIGQPGNLPLLEVALSELWLGRDGNLLTHARYHKIGRVAGAIAQKADRTFDSFDSESQEITKDLFTQLVRVARPEERTVDTRRRALRPELAPWAETALVDEVIHELAEERLITVTGGHGEEPLGVELAHEALLREWPKLAAWINAEREDLITHRWLADEAAAWEKNGREPSYLLSGARMGRARDWVKRHPEKLTDLERMFLRESITAIEISEQRQREQAQALLDEKTARAEAERLRAEEQTARAEAERLRAEEQTGRYHTEKRFARRLLLAVVALIAISLLALWFAWYSDVQKKKATWRNLLLKSEAALASQPQVSLLLALGALKFEEEHSYLRPASAENTLRQALANFVGKPLGYGEINAAAVSPDHRWLAAAGPDKAVRLWDLMTKDPAKNPIVLEGQEDRAMKIAISSDGRFVATYSPGESDQANESVRLWDRQKNPGKPFLLHGEDWLESTPFIGGRWLVTREFDLLLHDLASGNPVPRAAKLTGNPTALAFSPTGSWLAAGGLDGTVSVWDLKNPHTEPRKLSAPMGETAPTGKTRALAFSPDGGWLIRANADGTVTGWPRSKRDLEGAPIAFHGCEGKPDSLEIDRRGGWLLGWDGSHSACLWDLNKPAAAPRSLLGPREEEITAATFSSDGRWLFTAQKGAVRRWDLTSDGSGQRLWEFRVSPVTLLAISADGRWLVIGGANQTPRLLNLAKDNPADPDEPRIVRTPGGPFTTIELSLDGRSLATAGMDRKIRLRDMARQKAGLGILPEQQEPVTALAFSSDRRLLASGGKDGAILLWNLDSTGPRTSTTSRRQKPSVTALAISPDNHWLVAGSAGGESLGWELPAPDPTKEWSLTNHRDGVTALAFSGDGRWLVTAGGDGQARVYTSPLYGAADPMPLPYKHRGSISAVAISPDGQWLVTASADGPARLWPLPLPKDADPIPLPREDSGALTTLVFSPNGRRLAGGGRDGTIRLWEIRKGDTPSQTLVFRKHDQEVRALAFSLDGHWLVSADANGTVRRWDLRLDELKRLACEKAGRNLSRQEWRASTGRDEPPPETCPGLPHPPDG